MSCLALTALACAVLQDYVLPNNRAAGLYYHDHAVGITSANTYAGLTGMRLTRPCQGDDP